MPTHLHTQTECQTDDKITVQAPNKLNELLTRVVVIQIVLRAGDHSLWTHFLPQMSGALHGPQPELPSVQGESV